jgi:hypothetical protein
MLLVKRGAARTRARDEIGRGSRAGSRRPAGRTAALHLDCAEAGGAGDVVDTEAGRLEQPLRDLDARI